MSITHFMYDKWSCINFQTNECIFGLINVFHFDSRGMKNLPRLSWRKWPRFMHRKKRSQKTERRRRWWNLFLIQYNWYAKELIKNFEAPWSFKGKIIAVLKLRQEKRWEAIRWRNHTPAWLLLMHFDIKHSTEMSLLSLAFWTKQSRQRVVRKSSLVSSSCRMLDCHARGWGFKP